MKVITLLVLCHFALAGPLEEDLIYFPDNMELNLLVENDNGRYQLMMDCEKMYLKSAGRLSISNIEFDLYTSSNTKSPYVIKKPDVELLKKSNFDANKLNLFIIHGWTCDRNSNMSTCIKDAVFARGYDFNVFVVDWSKDAGRYYMDAKRYVVSVGQKIGHFINSMQVSYVLSGWSFVLVGHSLGAHVAGSAGATSITKIGNIFGLDPAAPLFRFSNPDERLDISDAAIVQIIHIHGFFLGLIGSIGHIDYYPNGGMAQPGCGLDFDGGCAHSRAYEYLAEAISRGPVFQGVMCSNYSTFEKGLCANNSKSIMGQLVNNTDQWGKYFLNTNRKKPYGRN